MGILKLELEEQRVFNPGDKVKGLVHYNITEQEKLDEVIVQFRGIVKTEHITRYSRNTEEITLFRQITPLFRGPFTMQPQEFVWPFEFTFPTRATHRRGQYSGKQKYATDGTWFLPPSFITNLSDLSASGGAHVEYSLKVKVNQDRLMHHNEREMHLRFRPTSQTPSPPLDLDTRASSLLKWSSSSLRPEKHSVKQKMAHVFSKDPELKTPGIYFKAHLGLPHSMSWDHVFALPLHIDLERHAPTDPESPSLILESINVRIDGITSFRVDDTTISEDDCETRDQESQLCLFGLSIPLPLDGSDIAAIPDFRLERFRRLVPDFTSWTVYHWHAIKVDLSIKHLESGHVFEIEIPPRRFEVLQPYAGTTGIAPMSTSNGEGGDPHLPSYEGRVQDHIVASGNELPTYAQAWSEEDRGAGPSTGVNSGMGGIPPWHADGVSKV